MHNVCVYKKMKFVNLWCAIRRKNEKRTQIAAEVVLKPIRREIEKVIGMPIPDEDLGAEIPEDVDAYTKMNFRDHVEEMVYTGLTYCTQKWGHYMYYYFLFEGWLYSRLVALSVFF